jgi:hypothetical protein
MSKTHDGGWAFPITHLCYQDGDRVKAISGSGGMSLRDYFAGQALMASDWGNWEISWPDKGHEIAEKCYRLADSMLQARKAKGRDKTNGR